MKKVSTLLFLVCVFSCTTKNETSNQRTEAVFFIKDRLREFKRKNIKAFPQDSMLDLNNEKPIYETHTPIIEKLYHQIFQDTVFIDSTLHEGTEVLYSIQNEIGHQGILIASINADWVDNIIYRSYDNNGKFIDKPALYQKGGDGGYYTHAFGKFINDTIYLRTDIECEQVIDDMEKEIEKCDTVKLKFCIHYNGKIEQMINN